jgi:hypothetical protein
VLGKRLRRVCHGAPRRDALALLVLALAVLASLSGAICKSRWPSGGPSGCRDHDVAASQLAPLQRSVGATRAAVHRARRAAAATPDCRKAEAARRHLQRAARNAVAKKTAARLTLNAVC